MAYITKNANMMLLFLVVLTVTFLVGATVFYQTNLNGINKKYNTKVGQLKNVEKELNAKIQILEQIREDLKLKSAREETFTEKFTEVRSEKEELEEVRVGLEGDVEDLEDELSSTKIALQTADNRRVLAEARAAQLESNYDECLDDLDNKDNLYKQCTNQLDVCQAGAP